MKLVILLTGRPPAGAALTPGAAPVGSPWPVPDPRLYANYCAQAASYYGPRGVTAFELWNEPNLDAGYAPPPKTGTEAGWGYLSPRGFASIATAAYPAIKAAAPAATVLGGSLGVHGEFGHAGVTRAASWGAVPAGATRATINCAAASATDAWMLLADTGGVWPAGTVIIGVDTAYGTYSVAPPYWMKSFPAIPATTSGTVRAAFGYPPDVFLARAYAEAAGKPMWDALAIHPYTVPYLPTTQPAVDGGWATVPGLRNIMIGNGEGSKPMWITEVGADTGAGIGSWPAASAGDTSITVTSPDATSDDLHYYFAADGVPAGSYVSAAVAGTGWTVKPPTGLVLATPVAARTSISSLTIAATAQPVTIQAGALIKVAVAPADPSGATEVIKTTVSNDITTLTDGTTSVQIGTVTPQFDYPAGSPIQADLGQAWGGHGIGAGANQRVYVYPPGVSQTGAVGEATQAEVITQVLQVRTGIPLGNGTTTPGWPYIGALFVYCWSDAGAGTGGAFGLTRADGTPKPALAALTSGTTVTSVI